MSESRSPEALNNQARTVVSGGAEPPEGVVPLLEHLELEAKVTDCRALLMQRLRELHV